MQQEHNYKHGAAHNTGTNMTAVLTAVLPFNIRFRDTVIKHQIGWRSLKRVIPGLNWWLANMAKLNSCVESFALEAILYLAHSHIDSDQKLHVWALLRAISGYLAPFQGVYKAM